MYSFHYNLPDKILGVFTGSGVLSYFWLYWLSTFMDLMLTLLSLVLLYNTSKSLHKTKHISKQGIFRSPVNIWKGMLICFAATVFLRVSMDTIILLTWQEVTEKTMEFWQVMNQVFDSLAFIPFISLFYLYLRAGPVLEFQLLRQPIPTDLHPSWKMVRGPVVSLLMVVLLSLLVVSTKLIS